MARSGRPPEGAYAPLLTVPSPGETPQTQPRFRVLIHKSDWKLWQTGIDRAGVKNMIDLWDHLAFRPDQPPILGTVTRLRGGHMKGSDGWSTVHHYELTGAARVDYQSHPRFVGEHGDEHGVVKIIKISFDSH